MSFSIYSLRKNGELFDQATVNETKNEFSIELKPLPYIIHHMDSYMIELFNIMMQYEKEYPYNNNKIYKTKRYQYMNSEYIEATIFHRVFMRKGSYFYVQQTSDRGTRFLLYAMNRVHHSSDSLGCSMHIPNVDEQRREMKKILYNDKISYPDLIENDSLYFL